MLAVLPFENLGSPEDAYFAAGMTEEITSRLAQVSGLGVISRSSAIRYEGTEKSIRQIGEELGVGFVLEGTVRWAPQPEGPGRVRITPQLIRVADDTHVWANSYDRVLNDIFAIQSEIAQTVVGQLGVTLLPQEQQSIEARPTESLEAYQAYLRGIDYLTDPDWAKESSEAAVRMFEQAVGHDPAFVAAHGLLSEAHTNMYWHEIDKTPERRKAAREAALRALELDPDSPEGHRALGRYHYQGDRDYQQALEEYTLAANRLPNDSRIAAQIAYVRRRQGRFDEAIAGLKKALELDPRNAGTAWELGETYRYVRQHREANRCYDLSISLAPNQATAFGLKAENVIAWKGSLERARATLESMPRADVAARFFAWFFLERFERNYQAALDRLAAAPEGLSAPFLGGWKPVEGHLYRRDLYRGDLYRLLNQPERARASYEAERVVLEERAKEMLQDQTRLGTRSRIHSSLGFVYAGLGRKADAIREAQHAVDLLPVSKDALDGVDPVGALAVVYTRVGEREAAIDKLEYLLSIPSVTTAWILRLDPTWDPLRDHPRFKKLVGEDWRAEAPP
jgi:serine/threonine-protein kinase